MIALFVLKLSAGITLMWWLMPRRDVTDGFFRIQMRIVLGLAVLATLLLFRGNAAESTALSAAADVEGTSAVVEVTPHAMPEKVPPAAAGFVHRWQLRIQIAVALIAYAGSVFWALGRRLPGNLCIHAMAVGCCGSVVLYSVYGPGDCVWLQLLSDLSSAAVCGSVLTGMLLGHWYLTTPTMSTRPLLWFNIAIVVAACLRLAASATTVITHGVQMPGTTHWIWLGSRWLGSILVPLIVAAMVWRILRYRNTQSATGVLFAGLVLVLMGEVSGTLLEHDLKIPY